MAIHVAGHIPQQDVGETVEASTPEQAVEKFKRRHPGAVVEFVGERQVAGECFGCGKVIWMDESFLTDDESQDWHRDCVPSEE